MSRIILASASPRRAELLRAMGVEFDVVPSRAEELHDATYSAAHLCEANAQLKANEIAAAYPDAIVIGADTLVTLDGRLYGKPRDLDEAESMLGELAGNTHQVITGVCIVQNSEAKRSVFSDLTNVQFKALTRDDIRGYLALVPVLDKAGAYGIQEHGELLVAKVEGSFSNVIGLPMERLATEFDRWGVPYSNRNR